MKPTLGLGTLMLTIFSLLCMRALFFAWRELAHIDALTLTIAVAFLLTGGWMTLKERGWP